MSRTVHPGRIGLHQHPQLTHVQAPPPATASPRSYHGARRSHRPQRRRAPLRGRTDTTTAPAASSNSTASMTVRASPNTRCHRLVFRTPFCSSLPAFRQLGNVGTRRGATADGPTHPTTDRSGDPQWRRHHRTAARPADRPGRNQSPLHPRPAVRPTTARQRASPRPGRPPP
jgi:hypothetical protein